MGIKSEQWVPQERATETRSYGLTAKRFQKVREEDPITKTYLMEGFCQYRRIL